MQVGVFASGSRSPRLRSISGLGDLLQSRPSAKPPNRPYVPPSAEWPYSMQAREQAIFSTKAAPPPLFTSPAVCANHLPTPNFRDAAAPRSKGCSTWF
jgi:hypothetical protein